VVIGKTNVPIYTTDLQSYNVLFGATSNPWDLSRTCGGSSGGAAAAVACGLTDFELGSDIGGSIRIPAHFCGIYGHKPSFGQVPFRGHIPPPPGDLAAPDLAVIGPLARSAEQLSRTLRVLAPALPAAPPRRIETFRVAAWFDDADFPLDRAVREVLDTALDRLAAAGVSISFERPVPALREVFDNYLRLLWPLTTAHLTPRALQRLVENSAGHATDSWHARLARYATASHRDWLAANEARARLRARCRDFFSDRDLLLLPVGPVTAFAHDHSDDLMARSIVVDGRQRWYWEQMAWISLATAAYLPATVAPAGLARDGLPVGLQIVGPELADFSTIEFARRMEAVLGGFRAPPGFA
jgi:amidase